MSTPNILLTISTPLVTAGPAWASNVEANWLLLDAHDHSTGKGLKVTPAGLNINATLPFNSFDATQLRTTKYDSQGTSLSAVDQNAVYVVAGNLYFNNGTGSAVQITSGTSLNVSGVGGITGLGGTTGAVTYSNITKTFSFTQNAGITASMDHGPITIRENIAAANGITIQSPASLAGNYSITLPTVLPGSTQPLSLSATGILSAAQITAGQIVSDIALNGNISATGTITATTGLIVTSGNTVLGPGLLQGSGGAILVDDNLALSVNNITQSTGTIQQTDAASFVDTAGYVQALAGFRIAPSFGRIGAAGTRALTITDNAGANPKPIVTSYQNGTNSLVIFQGQVADNSSILSGVGFTVTWGGPGTGNYTINFNEAFSGNPVVLTSVNESGIKTANVTSVSTTSANIETRTSGAADDITFSFVVIGNRNV